MEARISRMIAAVGIILAILFVSLGFLGILPWQTSGTLTATTIGLVSLILAAGRRETSNEAAICEQPKLEGEGELLWEELFSCPRRVAATIMLQLMKMRR